MTVRSQTALLQLEPILEHGYPGEEYQVTTTDGYILTVHTMFVTAGADPGARLPGRGAPGDHGRRLHSDRTHYVCYSWSWSWSTATRERSTRWPRQTATFWPYSLCLLQLELILEHGYPGEEHQVTTADGYILTVLTMFVTAGADPGARLPGRGAPGDHGRRLHSDRTHYVCYSWSWSWSTATRERSTRWPR